MALKTFKPTTPGQRQLVLVDRAALYSGKPVKSLTEGKISSGSRNNNGRITVRFRGGGHKKALRLVDFNGYRDKRVLEVGCGAGTDLVRFARGGAHVTGVDLSSSAIALARQSAHAPEGVESDVPHPQAESPGRQDLDTLVREHAHVA